MLKIITNAYDAQGNDYPTDVVVNFVPDFNSLANLQMRLDYSFHINQAAYDAGYAKVQVIDNEIDRNVIYNNVATLTEAEADNPTKAMVTAKAIEFLESIYGPGNIVDLG